MSSAYVSKKLRETVARQARHSCGYCLSSEAVIGLALDVEHLIPQALGGPTVEENLWLACSACNSFKGHRISGRDPESGESVRLFNPREQDGDEHFVWVDAGLEKMARVVRPSSRRPGVTEVKFQEPEDQTGEEPLSDSEG